MKLQPHGLVLADVVHGAARIPKGQARCMSSAQTPKANSRKTCVKTEYIPALETSRKRGDLGDDIEDDKSLVGRSISSSQQNGTNQHQGSCKD